MDNDELIELSDASHLDSIYFNKLSYFSSKLSAGGAIETCRAVFQGRVKNAIAVIRPLAITQKSPLPWGFACSTTLV